MNTKLVKYPRTLHLPFSESVNSDDKTHSSTDQFVGRRVIVTEKMDGENTTMYNDYIHARSLDSKHHYTRDWVKAFWATIKSEIPDGWRVCGENLYAKHSIHYTNLPTYFMGFSIWDEQNVCLSWDETLDYFSVMGITPVPVIYDGIYDENLIKSLWNPSLNSEGYVIRIADSISYKDFSKYVGKFVRKNHVQALKHWMHVDNIEINILDDK